MPVDEERIREVEEKLRKPETAESKRSITGIQGPGAHVEVDNAIPDEPTVKVRFSYTQVTDEGIKELQAALAVWGLAAIAFLAPGVLCFILHKRGHRRVWGIVVTDVGHRNLLVPFLMRLGKGPYSRT
jgi:hypothetical protein